MFTRHVYKTVIKQIFKYMLTRHGDKIPKDTQGKLNLKYENCVTRHSTIDVDKTPAKYMSTRYPPYLVDMYCVFWVSCKRLLRSWCLVNGFGVLSTRWDYRCDCRAKKGVYTLGCTLYTFGCISIYP